jgi:ElaB/YqjD/DUF883 family membrane-anchored ribosome-binding protein
MGEGTDEVKVYSGVDRDTGLAGEPLSAEAAAPGSSDEIAAKIEETRRDMDDTVDAIQQRLAPDQLVAEGLDRLRDAIERNSERVIATLRRHPIVTSAVGLGIGWLLIEGASPYSASRYPTGGYSPGMRERASHIGERAREQASHIAEEAREQAAQLSERVKGQAGHLAGQAREQAGQLAGQLRGQAAHAGSYAYDQAGQAGRQFNRLLHDNPMAMSTMGFALGTLLGLLVPETRKEDELMGETRDDLMEKAKEASKETFEKAQHVAEAAAQAATDEAKRQNLTPEGAAGLVEKAERVAGSAAGAAREEADKQGLTKK